MRFLIGSFSFVALIMFAGVATAKIDECQPDGMSDVEAARIIAIATQQGKAFRVAIDKMRAGGVSYKTDTAYDDLMADPERALALAKERYEGRRIIGAWTRYRLERGDDLDTILREDIQTWISKKNVNFFTTELTSHLQQLAILLGGEPTESPYKYKNNTKTFVFALGHFTKGAEFKYIRGSSSNRSKYTFITNEFSEEWALYGRKPNFEILIHLTTNLTGEDVTLEYVSFNGVDWLKGSSPIFQRASKDCLATFTQMEK